ncbi:aminoglycoside phosphotransferase family protein [Amphritea sp.]|uniref:aminoglycoside phosphotransferase family protein n=1 Tax=Amphritea sp. TaxID=1872502 RepID=UPI003D0F9ADD
MSNLIQQMIPVSPDMRHFLALHGFEEAELEPIPSDASPRRYFRLTGLNRLLMVDRADKDSLRAYIKIADYLNSVNVSAPTVYAHDYDNGLAIIEDFGDGTYTNRLAQGHSEKDLYVLAIDALLHLHRQPCESDISLPEYDIHVLLDEVDIFSDWFAPAVAPELDREKFKAAFRQCWETALAPLANNVKTLVLRDFHVDNLMYLPDKEGVERCGVLDFQDAILGACEYDLVSLLQDARRDLTPGLESYLLSYYIENAAPSLGSENDIRTRYALLGAQRHARILGVFTRLYIRDGKPRYLDFIPRVLKQFLQASRDANLHQLSELLEESMPGWSSSALNLSATSSTKNGVSDV